ncbi:DeoR/GlpR family DNA-binding transcription regulator [Georgenia alba]|uniref:DeoR/GlpR family DNA-binding transcription regulator n=1 Tax=Georgenia alba TaxID=2233858 RepID=A0ABW2QCP7_9MICO
MARAPRTRPRLSTTGRRQLALDLVRAREFVPVSELADELGVSLVTARGDVAHLAGAGLVRQVRGGAIIAREDDGEPPFEVRLGTYPEEKAAIGAAAAALVEPGSAVVLDGGTTCMAIAHALVATPELTDLTVYTPSLSTALALEAGAPRLTVVVTGGTVYPRAHSLGGPYSELILERVIATVAFVGCNGISDADGISAATPVDAELKRRMLASAKLRVAAADASKFVHHGTARVCRVDEVDLILTAGLLEDRLADAVGRAGGTVRRA